MDYVAEFGTHVKLDNLHHVFMYWQVSWSQADCDSGSGVDRIYDEYSIFIGHKALPHRSQAVLGPQSQSGAKIKPREKQSVIMVYSA